MEAAARATYEGLPGARKRKLPVHVSVLGGLGQVLHLHVHQVNGGLSQHVSTCAPSCREMTTWPVCRSSWSTAVLTKL